MKAKVVRGGGFRGALGYVLDEGEKPKGNKRPEILAGTMLGTNARQLSAEFAAVRQMRPDVKKPVWHCSLSCPPGERLDSDKWAAIAEDYMQEMRFPEGTQWVAIRHNDAEHEGKPRDHIHIIASRISVDGQIWLGKFEAMRAIDVCQELEERHGITRTKGLTPEERAVKPPRPNVRRMAERKGEPLDKLPQRRLQQFVYNAMQGSPSVVQFAERLQAAGVSVRPTIAKTGRMSGFSFAITDDEGRTHAFKGSQLGKAFTWNGLQKAGVTYDPERDCEALVKLTAIKGALNHEHTRDFGAAASHDAGGTLGRGSGLDGNRYSKPPLLAGTQQVRRIERHGAAHRGIRQGNTWAHEDAGEGDGREGCRRRGSNHAGDAGCEQKRDESSKHSAASGGEGRGGLQGSAAQATGAHFESVAARGFPVRPSSHHGSGGLCVAGEEQGAIFDATGGAGAAVQPAAVATAPAMTLDPYADFAARFMQQHAEREEARQQERQAVVQQIERSYAEAVQAAKEMQREAERRHQREEQANQHKDSTPRLPGL